MKKIITVYIVASDDKKVTFATKSKANEAIELLSKFDITATIEQVKKEIKEVDKNILTETEAVKLWHLINNRENSFSYGFNQKGGLNVAIERVEK